MSEQTCSNPVCNFAGPADFFYGSRCRTCFNRAAVEQKARRKREEEAQNGRPCRACKTTHPLSAFSSVKSGPYGLIYRQSCDASREGRYGQKRSTGRPARPPKPETETKSYLYATKAAPGRTPEVDQVVWHRRMDATLDREFRRDSGLEERVNAILAERQAKRAA